MHPEPRALTWERHPATSPHPHLRHEPAANRVTDEPDGDTRWLYLWEHRFGALHLFRSAAGRWHHLATLDRPQVAWFDAAIAHDIEAREN